MPIDSHTWTGSYERHPDPEEKRPVYGPCDTCGKERHLHGRLGPAWPIFHPEPPDFGWTYDTPVHEAVGQALGAASMCWEHVEKAGVFNSVQAILVHEALMEFLKMKLIGVDV